MNIYLFSYEDETISFPGMFVASTPEEAAAAYKADLTRGFNGLYDDVDPMDHLVEVLYNYAPIAPEQKKLKDHEVVTAFPRKNLPLPSIDTAEKRLYGKEASLDVLQKASQEMVSLRRGDCEKDPSFKQLIPYVILKHEDRYFAYKRLSGSGEQRLVDSVSIGVGGHMNFRSENGSFESLLELISNEALREINEELIIGKDVEVNIDPTNFRILNDDLNEVGQVHLGLILFVELTSDDVLVRETDSLEGEFVSKEWLIENIDTLESWSQIYVESDLIETVTS